MGIGQLYSVSKDSNMAAVKPGVLFTVLANSR